MKAVLVLALGMALPAITRAQPPGAPQPAGKRRESSAWWARFADPKVAFGGTLVFGGYAGSILWAQQGDDDHDPLYVPLFGPWLELFTLPGCEGIDLMCEHDTASRAILIASGATQLLGAGLIIYSLTRDDEKRSNIMIAPSMTNGAPGITMRGRF